MASDPGSWEHSSHSDIICYREVWKDSALSKVDFLSIMEAVAEEGPRSFGNSMRKRRNR
jgi:hypothetical protein